MRKMEVEDQNQRVGTVRRRMKVAIFCIKLFRDVKVFHFGEVQHLQSSE